jgi:hypothetical protein
MEFRKIDPWQLPPPLWTEVVVTVVAVAVVAFVVVVTFVVVVNIVVVVVVVGLRAISHL